MGAEWAQGLLGFGRIPAGRVNTIHSPAGDPAGIPGWDVVPWNTNNSARPTFGRSCFAVKGELRLSNQEQVRRAIPISARVSPDDGMIVARSKVGIRFEGWEVTCPGGVDPRTSDAKRGRTIQTTLVD